MAATIFVVRYRLQHIQPLKYDKIVQPEMAKRHGKSITRELQNQSQDDEKQYITATRIDRHIHR